MKTPKIKGEIDGNFITNTFFPQYKNYPRRINGGLCMKWAYVAYLLYENVSLCSNENHAFVEQNGKYFDSESPNGIDNHEQLRCCESFGNYDLWDQNLEEFIEEWKTEFGNSIPEYTALVQDYFSSIEKLEEELKEDFSGNGIVPIDKQGTVVV